jgi:hypothetical protein
MSMASLDKDTMKRLTSFDIEAAHTGLWNLPPSEGRPGVDATLLFGPGNDQLGLGKFELDRDLAALAGVESVLEFSAQFFNVLFDGHRRHFLMFEKDDTGIREG